ncbi:MAG: biosynthetic peptidoglycan transglycosylase [Bacteroidota bacterium]
MTAAPRSARRRLPGAAVWAWLTARPWRLAIGVVGLFLLIVYPFAGGAIAARLVGEKLSSRLGTSVRFGHARAGLLGLSFRDIQIGGTGDQALARVARMRVPFAAVLLKRGAIEVDGLTVNARRGGSDDNVTAIVTRLRHRDGAPGQTPAPSKAAAGIPGVVLRDAHLKLKDAESGLSVEIQRLGCRFIPGDRIELKAETIDGVLALGSSGKGPRFGAASIAVAGPLDGARPRGYPTLVVAGGFATPLPTLALTGIQGKIHPAEGPEHKDPAQVKQIVVDLDGSYGGSRETLWTARGGLNPEAHEGQLSLRAERFSLAEIADVLPKTVLAPENTTVDAAFDVSWADGAVRFGGDMKVAGLSIEHPGLASEPVMGMDLALILRGTAFPSRRRVAIDRLEGRIAQLQGKLSGFVELAPGSFTFADGSKLGFLPRLELTLEVPKLPCAQALASLPPTLVPQMQGFVLQGMFGAEIATRVDFADLEALELKGKIGIDGCRVLKPSPTVKALISGDSWGQSVEVPKAPGARGPGDTEDMEFVVGPENPDFVPYEQISPHLVASIMTTEDNGFFKHRGWVSSEFRNALKRNLQRGGFRGGASSITMQMVKNVLLSHEKTLSRKLQELFLVWYLEHEIPKERILELYFNAIEFGPRIYGIGRAAHHYFGKNAADLTPLEGAFFSSILPSPKRRYIQYCHGQLTAQWDRYVHRILAKMHERGRVSDEDYQAGVAQKLVFDRREPGFTERQCLDWVKKITARPEAEAPPDIDAALDGEGEGDNGPIPVGKLRRLFSKDVKRGSPARTAKNDARNDARTTAGP